MSDRNKHRVLLVEDSAAVVRIVRTALERTGVLVDVASDGLDAWGKLNRKQFDLVVTDEQMPLMGGLELCQLLRKDDRYAKTPVIFLTSKKYELDRRWLAEELHVVKVLGKPFSARLLTNAVKSQLAAGRSAI